jgi:hypothetical protein
MVGVFPISKHYHYLTTGLLVVFVWVGLMGVLAVIHRVFYLTHLSSFFFLLIFSLKRATYFRVLHGFRVVFVWLTSSFRMGDE